MSLLATASWTPGRANSTGHSSSLAAPGDWRNSNLQRRGLDVVRWIGAAEALELMSDRHESVSQYLRRSLDPLHCNEWTPPLNGGRLAFAERRRPSSIQAGMASASAPAMRHSRAADRASGSSGSPSLVPSKIAGHLGQQVGPAPGQRSDFGQRGRLLVLGERAPLGAMPRLAGQLSHQDPVGISAGTILVHLSRIEPDYAKSNLISKNNIRGL